MIEARWILVDILYMESHWQCRECGERFTPDDLGYSVEPVVEEAPEERVVCGDCLGTRYYLKPEIGGDDVG